MSNRKQIEFEKSTVKYSDDLNNLLSDQAIACDLTYIDESAKEHNVRLKRVGRKIVASEFRSENVPSIISFVFIIGLAIFGFFMDGDFSERALVLIMILGLYLPMFGLSYITSKVSDYVKLKPHYLAIDNTNFNIFQPRILDGRFYIIHNHSFDSHNALISMPGERFEELGYGELIILDKITRFEETNDGMYITATAQIRTNMQGKKKAIYKQSKDNIPIKVYIQRGLYSENFKYCCRRSFCVTDYITKDMQSEDKLPDAIMEIEPWDIMPYPELLNESSSQLDNCQVFYCQDENQPLKYRLSQFYKDESGKVFYIQYMKSLSDNGNLENVLEDNIAKELSKTREKCWGKYYADRHMKGYVDWNGNLGEAKVTYLKDLKVKKTAKGKVRITYMWSKGIRRKLKVPDVFGGLETLSQDK